MKYMKLSILSILFILPLATALEQSCTGSQNLTTQIGIAGQNETFNISSEGITYSYNGINGSFNVTETKTINFLRNISCTYNLTDNTNVSILQNVLYNISRSAEIIAKDGADRSAYFEQYASCLANYTTCQAELNISQSKQEFEQNYNTCVKEKTDIIVARDSCLRETDGPSGLAEKVKTCQASLDSQNNWKFLWYAIVFAIGFLACWFLKVKPMNPTDSIHKESRGFD